MRDGKPWRVRKAERQGITQTVKHKEPRPSNGRNPHKPRGIIPWAQIDMPQLFEGQTVVLVGGGPSLKPWVQEKKLAELHETFPELKWIAVNNSYKIAPWADLLHFADCQWWRWNGEHVLKTWPEDRYITTATSDVEHVNDPRIKRFWRDRKDWSEHKGLLHGWDSGTQAVHLAYHLGAAKILLLGFDMQPAPNGDTQWHKEHQRVTLATNYVNKFRPALERVAKRLTRHGIPIYRLTEPGLASIPFRTVDEALT